MSRVFCQADIVAGSVGQTDGAEGHSHQCRPGGQVRVSLWGMQVRAAEQSEQSEQRRFQSWALSVFLKFFH